LSGADAEARARAEQTGAKGRRAVYFGRAFVETPLLDRAELPAGGRVKRTGDRRGVGSTTGCFPANSSRSILTAF